MITGRYQQLPSVSFKVNAIIGCIDLYSNELGVMSPADELGVSPAVNILKLSTYLN